ncbi:MAG TPA: RDD family protein [Ilumatobacteraceae bacterium]
MNPDPGVDLARYNQAFGLPATVVLARLWRRVVGQVIDEVVIVLPVLAIALLAGVRTTDDLSDHALAINIVVVVIGFCYEFVCIGMWGRTLGKRLIGTRVVRVDTAGPVLWASSAVRALVPLAAGVIPGIGEFLSVIVYSSAFFDRRRQGLHDKAAGTIVVMHRSV